MRHTLLGLTLFSALALSTATAHADFPITPANTWVTGKAVRAVVRVGDRLFVGGDFTSIYPRSRHTGSLATFSHGEEDAVALPALSGGYVNAITDDGAGGWFAAGTFTRAGTVALDLTGTPRLVHLRSDGTVRQFAGQGLRGTWAVALAHSGGTLMLAYVRSSFSRYISTEYFIASFDAITGERRAPDLALNSSPVTTMVADSTRIYVFGHFSEIAGEPRAGAAAFDAASLTLTPWAPVLQFPLPSHPAVTEAEIDGTTVYLAGPFTAVAGQPRGGFAAISTTDGSLLPWAPSFGCNVTALAAGPDAVYLAGCEQTATQGPHGLLTAVDRTTGAALGWSVTLDAPVNAIDVSGSHLYVVGRFASVAGEPRLNAAAFTDRALDSWNPRPSDAVTVVVATPDRVAIAGSLSGIGAVPRAGLAEFDARTGALSPWVAPVASRFVTSLSTDGRWLFVRSGTVPCFGGVCEFVALALDGSGSVTIPQNTQVEAAAATRNRLYVAGAFGLIALDTTSGTQFPWHVPIHVRKILATETALYAVPYEPASAGHVLKVDARSGRVLPWGPVTTPSPIGELALSGPWLLVGIATPGSTGSALIAVDQATGAVVAEAPRSLVPAIDVYPAGPAWSPLINPPHWSPFTGGLAASPRGLLFSSNGTLRRLNPTTGSLLPWSVALDGPAQSLYADDTVIVAGGDFTNVGGVASPGLAIFPERVPSAPTNLTAIATGADVRFEWTPPADGDPSDYRLEAGTVPGASDIGVRILPPTPSYRIAGVPDGRYYVRVRAAVAAGVGSPSNEVELVVGVPPPLAPTGLDAVVDGHTVALMWAAPAGIVDQYLLDVGSRSRLSDLIRGAPLGLTTSVRFENVPLGAYYVRVRAINRTGSSPPSAELAVAIGTGSR